MLEYDCFTLLLSKIDTTLEEQLETRDSVCHLLLEYNDDKGFEVVVVEKRWAIRSLLSYTKDFFNI